MLWSRGGIRVVCGVWRSIGGYCVCVREECEYLVAMT